MKILAISDNEDRILWDNFDREHWKDIDLILSCGDLAPEYLSFLVTLVNVPLYYVRGNHDLIYDQKSPEGCEDIDGKIIVWNGWRILGLEGSMWYNGKPLQYTEQQMKWKLRWLRFKIWRMGGIDIVVSHAPPRGCNDGKDLCHKGFQAYRDLIARYHPRYFLHGHLHLTYGQSRKRVAMLNSTEVTNVYGHYVLEVGPGPLASK